MALQPIHRDEATNEFFDGTARKELLLRECVRCATINAPQARHCSHCASQELRWTSSGRRGSIVSWTVTHTKPDVDGNSDVNVIAIGQLDEGPWWWASLLNSDPEELTIGSRVVVDFARPDANSEWIPVFRLDE
jgi:uncharacterized OB-fold protein